MGMSLVEATVPTGLSEALMTYSTGKAAKARAATPTRWRQPISANHRPKDMWFSCGEASERSGAADALSAVVFAVVMVVLPSLS